MTNGSPGGHGGPNPQHPRSHGGADRILEVLRSRIASHLIPPGARLKEQALAEEFEVTRTRIREVLSALEERGLIEKIPHRGAVVVRLDLDQLAHIYDVREVLEGLCTRLATSNAPPGAWDELLEFFKREMAHFVEEGDLDAFVDGYERFRAQSVAFAANPVLADLLDSIYDKTQVAIRRIIILPGRPEVGLREHRAVLAAMAAGDAEEAERLRRLNMRSAKEYLIRYRNFVL